MEASARESEIENGKREINFFNNFLDEWYSFHSLTVTLSLALLLVSIYNKADGFYGWLCGKVHAYKVGPDSDNIQNTVQIEM